jgi:hypothetical protein
MRFVSGASALYNLGSLIMKRTFLFISLLLVLTLQAQSIETIPPINSVDLSERIFEGRYIKYFDMYIYDLFNIYDVEVSNENVFSMVGGYSIMNVASFCPVKLGFSRCIVYLTDRQTKSTTYLPSNFVLPQISNIGNTKDSAIINNTAIPLENSYYEFPLVDYTFVDYKIEKLCQQEKYSGNQLIGGLIKWATSNDMHDCWVSGTVNLWTKDGKHIWGENIKSPKGGFSSMAAVTKLCFSQNEKFLIFNIFSEGVKIADGRFVAITNSYLMDVETFKFLPANRDVEFTSDEKYYVTERNGLPSLVDVETHDLLLRYDPGSTMTACCFSPDDAKLYIACEDLKVYEFPSHVPNTAVEDWAVFE